MLRRACIADHSLRSGVGRRVADVPWSWISRILSIQCSGWSMRVTVDDWIELAERIWATNEANGWDVAIAADWDSNKRKLAEKIALIHSELSEAWQGAIDGDEANYLEELADVAIRILDVLEGLHPLEGLRRWFEAEVEPFNLSNRAEQIATVHLKISEALEYLRKGTLEHPPKRTPNIARTSPPVTRHARLQIRAIRTTCDPDRTTGSHPKPGSTRCIDRAAGARVAS